MALRCRRGGAVRSIKLGLVTSWSPASASPRKAAILCCRRDVSEVPIPDSVRCENDRATHYRAAAPLMREKRRVPSWTRPVERDVFARVGRPLKLEGERIDGTD